MSVLKDKCVVLGVTGGIAAYKAAELTRLLMTDGAEVRVVMTESACRFVTPLTFQALTRRPVVTSLWQPSEAIEINHISLAERADAVVIAPATANIIGKIVSGIADDFLSTFLMAVTSPVLVCPAMNVNMYNNPVVQNNLARLRAFGYHIVDPGHGELACGTVGQGRLPDPPEIMEEIRCALSPKDLAGLRVLVTSGPTREKWDDIRYISTPSSGRMGVALAVRARQRGAEVVLVTGPTSLPSPYGIKTIPVESTRDMQAAVLAELDHVDIVVKAAAPGDFRPAQRVSGKVKKVGGVPAPIELTRNPDILADIGQNRKGNRILVGFAAESENLLEYARGKLESKNLDLIVANQIGAPGAAFGTETNQVTLIDRAGHTEALPLLSKDEVAGLIWDRIAALVQERRGGQPQAS